MNGCGKGILFFAAASLPPPKKASHPQESVQNRRPDIPGAAAEDPRCRASHQALRSLP